MLTLTGLADRPGILRGAGPADPGLARDLAAAAARNPRSTWCVTVTDQDGHAVGHGCARSARRRKPDGHDPPFTLTPTGHGDPHGGYGTWRLTTGQQDMLIEIGPLPTGDCDHRREARGHDPGVMLRHPLERRAAPRRVPDGPAFREERVITAVERPGRLAYDMTAVYQDAPGFSTTVEVTIETVPDGNRVRLVQQGFPTPGARDDFAGAWPDVLDELARRVSSTRQT